MNYEDTLNTLNTFIENNETKEIENESIDKSLEKSFLNRSEGMGLEYNDEINSFEYSDKYSYIRYSQLQTKEGEEVPILAIYTSSPSNKNNASYIGSVSNGYHFIGNEYLNNKIRDNISSVNAPILTEKTLIEKNYAKMYNQIVIKNKNNVPKIGDIYPQFIISNSYNGTKSVSISFGLAISNSKEDNLIGTSLTRLGNIKQIHFKTSSTTISSNMANYIEVFNGNIYDLVESNLSRKFTETDVFQTLELIEKVSKRKRDEISTLLNNSCKDGKNSFWDMFNVIIKFSSYEKNINSKLILESIAERVLELPSKMLKLVSK